MGSVRFAMPLLSTLAALVIIVHSAEENYEREYRMLRPRALDEDTPSYDQQWRAREMEPVVAQPTKNSQSDTWVETDTEQPLRRRRVRKRKRRPQLPEDDLIPQERYTYNAESRTHLQENIDRPRRRRKKLENQNSNEDYRPSGWDEDSVNKPKRVRGQKRKNTPLTDSWRELSEVGGYRQQEQTADSDETTYNEEVRTNSKHYDEENNQKDINEKIDSNIQIYDEHEPEIETTSQVLIANDNQPQKFEDRSLSEFSIEAMRPNENPSLTVVASEIKDKTLVLSDIIEESKEKEPLNPLTLKTLLKRSNGKSLSEILQQNNLSLTDLLHGREKALSVLKKDGLPRPSDTGQTKNFNKFYYNPDSSGENVDILNNKEPNNPALVEINERQYIETTTTLFSTDHEGYKDRNDVQKVFVRSDRHQDNDMGENHRTGYMRRRFPSGIRRKQRMRPIMSNSYKSQLSRDMIALTSMKYKNVSKSREWKDIIPSIINTEPNNVDSNIPIETEIDIITTTPCSITETATEEIYETTTDPSLASVDTEQTGDAESQTENNVGSLRKYSDTDSTGLAKFTTISDDINTETEPEITTDKPKHLPILKPFMNASHLRRQYFNNRLKRKQNKQRNSTTENPEALEIKDTFGIGKFASASDLTAKTQTRTTKSQNEDDFTTLEDYLTTETSHKFPNRHRSKIPSKTKTTTFTTARTYLTTEETAKFEIEEILNDNDTGARLSKILKERNMTLRELIEHRERGSSHVHLADIFHNASKEPNPPEPFLSKSLIEPISKETYPLRALLEANLHDPKTTTIDPNLPQINNLNIPVVMNFGNNVNENSENMGIVSLFNNHTNTNTDRMNTNNESVRITHDSAGVHNNFNSQVITREGRTMHSESDSVTWNNLINIMQKKHQSDNAEVESMASAIPVSETLKKIDMDENLDGDGLIVLDNIEQLENLERENNVSSNEMLGLISYEKNKLPQIPNTTNSATSDTRSVTVVTASIIGIGLILFLLTYAVLKWKQQSKIFQNKHANEDEFVPTPVFESRKGRKINNSIRSKSPMLATSSIYAIDTIDTHVGSESPEYMWDTLRKPFQ